MSNLIKLALAASLLTASLPSFAQETTEVPDHHTYMLLCMETLSPKIELDAAAGFAVCQCHFESLPTDGDMTQDEFQEGLATCAAEAKRSPVQFAQKYLDRFEKSANDVD
jgi:hypothetical protein